MEKQAGYIFYIVVDSRVEFSRRSHQAARSLKENTFTSWSDRKADSMRLGGEHKTKLNYSTYQTKFDAKITKMKWNYMANIIMKYQEQSVKLSR